MHLQGYRSVVTMCVRSWPLKNAAVSLHIIFYNIYSRPAINSTSQRPMTSLVNQESTASCYLYLLRSIDTNCTYEVYSRRQQIDPSSEKEAIHYRSVGCGQIKRPRWLTLVVIQCRPRVAADSVAEAAASPERLSRKAPWVRRILRRPVLALESILSRTRKRVSWSRRATNTRFYSFYFIK